MTAHVFLGALADLFNPTLAILALAVPFVHTPRRFRSMVAFYLAAAAAIGIVYSIRAIDDRNGIWASFGLDYSTHSAFAASLTTSIAAFHRRWAVPLAGAVILYFALELFMRYHGVVDILSSALLAAIVAFLLHAIAVRTAR